MTLTIKSRVKLNNGVEIPILGLGTYLSGASRVTQTAILHALGAGYRHFDTAKLYRNEEDIGEAIRQYSVPREDIFLTTKLWNSDHGYDSTIAACNQSLQKLGVDYIDLYLIHWPVTDIRMESWRAMETLLEEGTCRAIGVCNYTIKHLKELLNNADIVPAVNQVEFHPFLYQKALLDFCRENGIQLEAYSPFAKGRKLNEPILASIGEHYNKTPAQVLVRWALEHRLVVIPKSSKKQRIRENADVFNFSITPEDMTVLNVLDENYRSAWDPTFEV
ncbi:MAG: aldo/keto reductase [Candidatus Thorarchaeota archaeon]